MHYFQGKKRYMNGLEFWQNPKRTLFLGGGGRGRGGWSGQFIEPTLPKGAGRKSQHVERWGDPSRNQVTTSCYNVTTYNLSKMTTSLSGSMTF